MAAEMIGLGVFKTMLDLAKGLKDINDATIRNAAIIELQEKILTAQAAQSELVERVGELEKEVAHLKTWETDKERYELVQIAPGNVAYALKASVRDGETPHYLCANCFSAGKKSFLQQPIRGTHVDRYKCNACGEELTNQKDSGPTFLKNPRDRGYRRGADPQSWMR